MLWGSSMLSEFCTSLSKVLTLWHCVKIKQRYHSLSDCGLFSNQTLGPRLGLGVRGEGDTIYGQNTIGVGAAAVSL